MRKISENGFGILANKWRVFVSENNIGKIDILVGLTDQENIETGELFEGFWRSDPYQGLWQPVSNSLHGNRQVTWPGK